VCSETLSVLIILQWSVPILHLWLFLKGLSDSRHVTLIEIVKIYFAQVKFLRTIFSKAPKIYAQDYFHRSEYIYDLNWIKREKNMCFDWFLKLPLIYWLSIFLYTQFYLTLFEYWCIDDILKIAIHQFYVNTNERTIQLWTSRYCWPTRSILFDEISFSNQTEY